MRILILSFYYYPDLSAGSFRTTALVEQLKQQVGRDSSIDVLTTMPNRYASYDIHAPLSLEAQANVVIRRIAIPSHRSGLFDQVNAFICYARSVRKLIQSEQYDVVFATSSRLMTAVLGTWVAQKKGAKLYLDIRDLFVDTIKDIFPQKIARIVGFFISFLEKWSFTRANRINLVSKGFADYVVSRYPQAQLSWFTNGIDAEFMSIEPIKPVSNDIQDSQLLTVLYAGNIGEGQGLHLIVPALAKQLAGRALFKIIGDGGRMTQLKEASAGISNIELLNPMGRQQLIHAYQSADVLFLHLNDYDAFHKVLPSKIFEYAALGKPIWAGVAGYAAQFIQSEIQNAVVFNPCNPSMAMRVFSKLIFQNEPRTEFMEKYARSRVMSLMASDVISLRVC